MAVTLVGGLPNLTDCEDSLVICESFAVLKSRGIIARISLPEAQVRWSIELAPESIPAAVQQLARWILVSGNDLWIDQAETVVVDLTGTQSRDLAVCARDVTSGKTLWQDVIPIPDAAEWAEKKPAWPGGQTEEIYAFIAKDSQRLVVCLYRHTRRSWRFSPEGGRSPEPPPLACQTDAVRFDPATGKRIWHKVFPDVRVEILERNSFTGIWSHRMRVGVIDWETGANAILHELPNALGWPVQDGSHIAVPWHTKGEVGIVWIDEQGRQTRNGCWREPRAHSTKIHATPSGLALQTNDQRVWWLGAETEPRWNVRTKPYIYRVYRRGESDVYVGTDGMGGRLFAFDAESGNETLNVKPVYAGFGDLSMVPAHHVLVSPFGVSRSPFALLRLLVLSMADRTYRLDGECGRLLGTWQHGAICRAGRKREQLAVFDVRAAGT